MTKLTNAKRWAKSLLNLWRRCNFPEIVVRDFIQTVAQFFRRSIFFRYPIQLKTRLDIIFFVFQLFGLYIATGAHVIHFLEFLPCIQAGLNGQPHVQNPDVQDGVRSAPDCVIEVFVVNVLLLVLFRPKRQWSAWFHSEQKRERESTKQRWGNDCEQYYFQRMVGSQLITRIDVANQMPRHDGADEQTHLFLPDTTYSDLSSVTGSTSKW